MESRLLVVSGILACIIVIFAGLGERTLPLFDGDRELAARVYKTGAMLLAGTAFAFAMPKLCVFVAQRAQALFAKTQAKGTIANIVNAESFPSTMLSIGYGLCFLFIAGTCLGAFLVWCERA